MFLGIVKWKNIYCGMLNYVRNWIESFFIIIVDLCFYGIKQSVTKIGIAKFYLKQDLITDGRESELKKSVKKVILNPKTCLC